MSGGRRLILALVVAPALGVGVVWTAANLGRVPTYTDTYGYLRLAADLRVDQYRGIAFPGLLAAAELLYPGDTLLTRGAPGQWCVQVLQLALCAAALAYFVSVLLPFGRPGRGTRLAAALLVALLLLDPLVSHFNLSLMPDALALSASLLFCAAFARLLRPEASAWVSGGLMLASYLVLANARAEKNVVLLAAGVTTIVVAGWWRRRRRQPWRRLLAAGIVLLLGFTSTLAIKRATYKARGRLPISEWILHHRVIYPHLSSVYERLPDHLKRQIPPRQARRYDESINSPRKVLATIGPRIDSRSELTWELAAIVARERWQAIAIDVAGDTTENLFASFSFYLRLGVLAVGGEETSRQWFRSGGSRYTYLKLAESRPALSRIHLVTSALLLAVAIGASLALLRCAAGDRLEGWQGQVESWLPVVAFCSFNALAFSLTADLVHIRYTVFAHTVFLALALRGLAQWALAAVPSTTAPGPAGSRESRSAGDDAKSGI